MATIVELLIPLGLFSLVFGIIYILITARNKERMAMIERGININEKVETRVKSPSSLMKFALPIVGIGFGLIFGQIIYNFTYPILPQVLAIISSSLLFGGLGILIYYMKFYKRDLEIYKEMIEILHKVKNK